MSVSKLRRRPPIAGDIRRNYRVLVKRSSKGFDWTIVDDDNVDVPLRQSTKSFQLLQEAHDAGSAALDAFRAQLIRSTKR
jgi:hypothetical protein